MPALSFHSPCPSSATQHQSFSSTAASESASPHPSAPPSTCCYRLRLPLPHLSCSPLPEGLSYCHGPSSRPCMIISFIIANSPLSYLSQVHGPVKQILLHIGLTLASFFSLPYVSCSSFSSAYIIVSPFSEFPQSFRKQEPQDLALIILWLFSPSNWPQTLVP